MNSPTLLSTENLRLSIGERTLCRDLNWQAQAGQCWAILGVNGAGKTTLLHTLAGLRTPERGTVKLLDKPLTEWKRKDIARHLGLLQQDTVTPYPGTVMEQALLGRHPHLGNWRWETRRDRDYAAGALQTVDMLSFANRSVQTLSGGERQRLNIATLLTQQPEIFLLDEPVNHLDWHQQHLLLSTLTGLVHKTSGSMIMVIHDVNLAARYCDHVLMMFEDGNVKTGDSDTLLNTENISKLYGYHVSQVASEEHGKIFIPG